MKFLIFILITSLSFPAYAISASKAKEVTKKARLELNYINIEAAAEEGNCQTTGVNIDDYTKAELTKNGFKISHITTHDLILGDTEKDMISWCE
jgi:hypothetical protein